MSFWRFLLVRLAWAVFGIWLAVTIVFVITRVFVTPRDLCGGTDESSACLRFVAEEFRLDAPLHERYLHFLRHVVTDQRSLATGQDAGRIARNALPATASLVSAALVLALVVAGVAGVAWSRAARKWDRLIRWPIYLAIGLSPVFLGLMLSLYVGYEWKLAPHVGYCDFFNPEPVATSFGTVEPGCGGSREWLSHLVLPAVTLGLFFAGIYARIVRGGIEDIRAGRGTEERRRLSRRLVLVLARVAGRDFGWAIGAAAIVEALFAIPGVGRTAVVSISNVDPGVLGAAVLYAATLGITVHFVVDVVVGALDSDLRAEWPVAGMPRPA